MREMTAAPQMRPLFQYHLSTAVLVLGTLSLLASLNAPRTFAASEISALKTRGWPVQCNVRRDWRGIWVKREGPYDFDSWEMGAVYFDVYVAALLVMVTVTASEWWIRRKTARPLFRLHWRSWAAGLGVFLGLQWLWWLESLADGWPLRVTDFSGQDYLLYHADSGRYTFLTLDAVLCTAYVLIAVVAVEEAQRRKGATVAAAGEK
jgi:hypothetical protein